MRLSYERFDIADLLRDVAGRFEDALERFGRRLELSASSLTGSWDCSRLDQIVTNLVANAVKYGGDAPICVP